MYVSANFTSRQINDGMKIFRHDTALHSSTTPGTVIGLVYMMNPGSARPKSNEIFEKLQQTEFSTEEPVITLEDNTMRKVARFVELAYKKIIFHFHNSIQFILKIYLIYEKQMVMRRKVWLKDLLESMSYCLKIE